MASLLALCPHCNTEIRTVLRAGPSGPPRIGAIGITCPKCARSSMHKAQALLPAV